MMARLGLLASFPLVLTMTACGAEDVASATAPVVYVHDDRIDVYEETDTARRTLAQRSIVAMIPKGLLVHTGTTYSISPSAGNHDDYVESAYGAPLCADQRFKTQPAIADCSGTLIADDLVLTAGHCAESLSQCKSMYFAFDYSYDSAGQLAQMDDDDVYECDRVVAQRYDEKPPYLDFAIIKLTRKVVGERGPAPIDETDDGLAIGTHLTVMGFGSGLPLKIDTGGEVLTSTSAHNSFDATTDTFAGNSGSGVFDTAGRVVGILVAGQEDYVARSGQACTEVNVLTPGVDPEVGETVTYVNRAIDALCAKEADNALCASCGDDVCQTNETATSCAQDCSGTPHEKGRCSVSAPGSDDGSRPRLAALLISCIALTTVRRRRS